MASSSVVHVLLDFPGMTEVGLLIYLVLSGVDRGVYGGIYGGIYARL